MNKSYISFKFIAIIKSYQSDTASLSNIKGTNMNISDLINTQSSLMNASDYSFDLPLNFNTVSDDVYSDVSSSERNGSKYSAKPYTICGEVNKDFYSYYIPFKKDVRNKP